jgi:hypothetical protein
MKKKTRKILILTITSIVIILGIFAIWYFKLPMTSTLQTAYGTPDVCFMSTDGVCAQATIPCDTSNINFYLTLEACQSQHPEGKEIYYHFANNACSMIALFPNEKTSIDYNTNADCLQNVIQEQNTNSGGTETNPQIVSYFYYRFSNNSCSEIELTEATKTINDYNSLAECQAKIINNEINGIVGNNETISNEEKVTEKSQVMKVVLIFIAAFIFLAGFITVVVLTKRKSKTN